MIRLLNTVDPIASTKCTKTPLYIIQTNMLLLSNIAA